MGPTLCSPVALKLWTVFEVGQMSFNLWNVHYVSSAFNIFFLILNWSVIFSCSFMGSQSLGNVSKMDLSVSASTPNKSTLWTPSRGVAMVTSTPLTGMVTPVRPLHDRANGVLGASPSHPILIPQVGFTLSSQAGGFLPSQVSSQTDQPSDTVHPLVSVDRPLMVTTLKPLSSQKVAAPVLYNPTNHIGDHPDHKTKPDVHPTTTPHVQSCVTRADSPELFDSEDLSSMPPNTCQVRADIDNVLKEITGEQHNRIHVPPGGAVVKPEGATEPQTISSLLSQIVRNKTRNGLTGLDTNEQRQSVDMASDTSCAPVQCRKPLFKYVTKSSHSVDAGEAQSETVTHCDTVSAGGKAEIRGNTRRASRLNLRRTSVDSVAEHNQSVSENQIQPLLDELHQPAMMVKCEPLDGASVADTSGVSDGTPLKRNVRNKRRRNFGNSTRKKGRGVEFIDEQTEGSTEVITRKVTSSWNAWTNIAITQEHII